MQKKAQQQINATEPSNSLHFNIIESLRDLFLTGDNVRVIDCYEISRAQVTSAIKNLQDQRPVITGCQTVRQSYLSETITGAKSYHITEPFLRNGGVL